MALRAFLPSRAPLLVCLVMTVGLLVPAVLWANIGEVSVSPPQPTGCDSVQFNVSGAFTDACWHYDGYDVEILPILTPGAPIGTVFRMRVLCHRDSSSGCALVIVPYEISHQAGVLPPGPYVLIVDEVDSGFRDVIYSHKELSFNVQQCGPPVGCVLPGFGPQFRGCNAIVSPGTPGFFYITLANPMPVAGAEMIVDGFLQFPATECAPVPCANGLRVTSVQPLDRAADMGVEWTFSNGQLHLMLHPLSPLDQGLGVIEPGQGPIARVAIEIVSDSIVYQAGQVLPDFDVTVTLNPVAFADENANPIPVCPTAVPITGTICVRSAAQKCDVNGDGRADVVDIVRMINCIMCPIPEGCCTADETARGDCNGDGLLNVTDVVCCIRNILGSQCDWCGGQVAPPGEARQTSVGLGTEPEWETETSFSIPVSVSSPSALGGVEMRLSYDPAVLAVEGVETGEGSPNGDAYFSASDGNLSMMVVALGGEPLTPGAGTLARVRFKLLDGAGRNGTVVSLVGAAGAGADGARLDVGSTNSTVEITTPSIPLLASRPNPFVGSTEISLYLDSNSTGSLRVYDAQGRLVNRVFEGVFTAGPHAFQWNGRDDRGRQVPSGVYFLKFDGGAKSLSKKVVLLRR